MTDVNGPEVKASDNRTVVDAAADGGSNSGGETWVAGLQVEENRALVEAKQWGSPDDALKSYRELQTHASKALVPPGEGATAEDWSAFHAKLGRPEKPDGYEYRMPEGLSDNFAYDEALAVESRNWAHEAGLTPRQADIMHGKMVQYTDALQKQHDDAMLKAEGEAHRDLIREWGDADTEGYKRNVEMAARAARNLGVMDDLTKAGMIAPDGGIRSATLAKALAKVGTTMFGEDSVLTGGGGVLKNPFSSGDSFNLTEQGKILRSDPKKAASLIRAAGQDPATYGL